MLFSKWINPPTANKFTSQREAREASPVPPKRMGCRWILAPVPSYRDEDTWCEWNIVKISMQTCSEFWIVLNSYTNSLHLEYYHFNSPKSIYLFFALATTTTTTKKKRELGKSNIKHRAYWMGKKLQWAPQMRKLRWKTNWITFRIPDEIEYCIGKKILQMKFDRIIATLS